MLKGKKNLLWLFPIVVITVVFLLPVFSGEYFDRAAHFVKLHPVAAPFIVIFFRFIGVVLAPLPGAPVSFASIAVFPWWQAWAYNMIGAELGVVTAFFIARRFREPVVAHFAPFQKIHEWQDKISHAKQFWAFAGLRLTALVALDFVSYAAGLSKLPFTSFLLACLLIDIPTSFLFFFFGGVAFQYGILLFIGFIIAVFLAVLAWKYVQKVS